MPFTFTTEEYANKVFIYGKCDVDATAVVNKYRGRYLTLRIQNA